MMESATRESSVEAMRNVLKNLDLTKWYRLSHIGLILKEEYNKEFDPKTFGVKKLKDLFIIMGIFDLTEDQNDYFARYKSGCSLEHMICPIITNDIETPGNKMGLEVKAEEEKIDWEGAKILEDGGVFITTSGVRRRLWSDTTPDWLIAKKLLSIRSSAFSRGLDFNLSFKSLKKILRSKKCFYTGIPFGVNADNLFTLDRVDASLGYVEGNVVACSAVFNGKKSNLTKKEILDMAQKIKTRDKAKLKTRKIIKDK